MNHEEAARLLDPETHQEAVISYIGDNDFRLSVIVEACRMGAKALRETTYRKCIVSDKELYQLALSTLGADAQTVMVFEEMAELQKELCKHARGAENRKAIAEEIADVLIMLEQMMILHNCEDLVFQYKQEKKDRLEKRLRG